LRTTNTGNSPGPPVDVAPGRLRDLMLNADVSDHHPAARLEHPVDLPVDADLVRAGVDDPIGDHHVGPAVLDGHVLDDPFAELDVLEAWLDPNPPAALKHLK